MLVSVEMRTEKNSPAQREIIGEVQGFFIASLATKLQGRIY
jgi:hypothetical protein